jgi:hypothetical protein
MKMLRLLSLDRLHEVLSYDEATGIFRWRVNGHGRRAGAVAGTVVSGGYISMVELITTASRILRQATATQNQFNRSRHKPNKTGYRGVCACSGGFTSQPKRNGRRVYLGTFKTAEEAHQAYLAFADIRDGEFSPSVHRVSAMYNQEDADERAEHRTQ